MMCCLKCDFCLSKMDHFLVDKNHVGQNVGWNFHFNWTIFLHSYVQTFNFHPNFVKKWEFLFCPKCKISLFCYFCLKQISHVSCPWTSSICRLQELKSSALSLLVDALFDDPWTNSLTRCLATSDYVRVCCF